MLIGTRLVYSSEVGLWNAELLQISVYKNMEKNIEIMMDSVRACRDSNFNYIIHPVGYSLLDETMLKKLVVIAEWSDLAVILHDERSPDGERIKGRHESAFRKAIDELKSITHISFENSTDTGDVRWFWDEFADSITIDIGHIEVAGLNSLDFIKSLDKDTINNIKFVHMHRNHNLRGGITDHWPLTHGCRELRALKALAEIKSDISVILELNETGEIGDSLNILRELRDKLQT